MQYRQINRQRLIDSQRLDQIDEGSDIQAYIAQEYGQRTVPQVFINQVG